jgi:hypothetical protein
MPTATKVPSINSYDTRWFIWTIVFLVVTGISLVSYIVLSGDSSTDVGSPIVAKQQIQQVRKAEAVAPGVQSAAKK